MSPFPLERFVTTIHDGYLPEEDLAALKKAVDESTNEEDIVTICFKSYPDRPITVEYRKWLPNAETSPSQNQDDVQNE